MARVTAVSSLGWAHYTLYEALPRIAAMGFTRVEIASFFSYCFHFNYGSPAPTELRKMLGRHRLTPVCLNYCGGFYDAWRSEAEGPFVRSLERKIAEAAEVGIPMMTIQGFGVRNRRRDRRRQLENAVRAFERVGKIGAKHGLRMLLEVPHLLQIMTGVKDTLWVLDRLDPKLVGALLDSSHWGVIGYDIDGFLAALGDRLGHVHLRDSRGSEGDAGGYDLEMTPGRGEVDFRALARALDASGYRGEVTLELEYRDSPFDMIEAEFRRGILHLERAGWELPHTLKAVARPRAQRP